MLVPLVAWFQTGLDWCTSGSLAASLLCLSPHTGEVLLRELRGFRSGLVGLDRML